MEDSILIDIKKMLGIDKDYTDFDVDVVIAINSVISTLYQIGIESAKDYSIVDAENTWSELSLDEGLLNLVKPYVYMKVRTMFDPPNNSFLLDSIKNQVSELEFRINFQAEGGFDYGRDDDEDDDY